MNLSEFSLVRSLYQGGSISAEKEYELFSELLFMVLTRASIVDLDVKHAEVDVIIKVLKQHLDKDVSETDIRVAAVTNLYEHASFDKYISKLSKSLSLGRRLEILDAVEEVLQSDGKFGLLEADFFNLVALALKLTPIEIRGLSGEVQ